MIDAHCHLDAYPDPKRAALEVERAGVLTIAVTNSPSAFEQAYPHVRRLRSVRLALGLHPLLGAQHAAERGRFDRSLGRTSYVGEVGLDFSPGGLPTRTQQMASFRHVLELIRASRKFVSVHSRRAETAVLDVLEELGVGPVVFHWYSGSLTQLERLLEQGHACSINAAMVRSARGRTLIKRLPPDRVLTETDGPYVTIQGRAARPGEVGEVLRFLASLWGMSLDEVRLHVCRNLRSLIPTGGQGIGTENRTELT
jgi:TatD DNase family protein